MNTNRTIKTTTALLTALRNAELTEREIRKVVAALKAAAKDGKMTSGATVTSYPDGWVAKSYRYRAPGRRITVECNPFGVTVSEDAIDRKRTNGRGPRVTVRALRPGMIDGTLVASL